MIHTNFKLPDLGYSLGFRGGYEDYSSFLRHLVQAPCDVKADSMKNCDNSF